MLTTTCMLALLVAPPPPPPTPPTSSPEPSITLASGSSDPEGSGSTGPQPDQSRPQARHEDLAAELPATPWRYEGGAAAPAGEYDSTLDDRIRRSAATMVSGGVIGVVGLAGVATGMGMYYTARPQTRLSKLEAEDGTLPAGDPKRRRIIRTARATPFVLGTGIALTVTGVVMAIVGRSRLRRFREQKRSLAFGVTPGRHAFTAQLSVRF